MLRIVLSLSFFLNVLFGLQYILSVNRRRHLVLPVALRSFTTKAAAIHLVFLLAIVQNILKMIPIRKKKSPDVHWPPVFTLPLLFQLFFVGQTTHSDLSNKPLNLNFWGHIALQSSTYCNTPPSPVLCSIYSVIHVGVVWNWYKSKTNCT